MLLAIDCGNTNTVMGLYDGAAPTGKFCHIFRMETDAGLILDDYQTRLTHEMRDAGLDAGSITGVVMASVVPGAEPGLKSFARAVSGVEPVVIGSAGVELGIKVEIDNPSEVGADRLVNAVAAHVIYGAGHSGPLIVLDFGTATTFDVVTSDGNYAGGIIAPGINLAVKALGDGAALLPKIEVVKPDRVIGTGTVSAMQSGIYWGYMGLIEGIVTRIRASYTDGAPFKVIATGGLAPLFADGTDVIDVTDPDLTLHGLVLLHQMNGAAS